MNNPKALSAIDPRIRVYVPPVAVVWQSTGDAASGAEHLLQPGSGSCHLRYKSNSKAAPGILLDFGRELHGGIVIYNGMTPKQEAVPVRVRFGESVVEAMETPNQDHAIHDQEILIPWYGSTEFGNTGFRFVRIDMVKPGAHIEIKECKAAFLHRDLRYVGSFRCSDERLNKIWDVGAYTVHLCMQDMLWDGIKRDRLPWIGDAHPETMIINSVFEKDNSVPRTLDYVRDETPLPNWMNGISSYSIWWILTHSAWYLYRGDLAYLKEQREYLTDLIDLLLEHIGEDNQEILNGFRFLDWPSSEDPAATHTGLHCLMIMAFRDGAALCDVLGESAYQQKALEAAERMMTYTPPPTQAKQANALLALSGLRDYTDINDAVLAVNPLQGISTFYGYYVLQARAKAGDYEGALEVIRSYWYKMLELGATTFWEDFNLDWTQGEVVGIDQLVPEGATSIHRDFGNFCYKGLRHSLCHGWAGGPTAWMSEHILGVRPMEPGCKTLLIDPHLADLDFAEGSFPTPLGPVTVRHEKTASGEITSHWEAPEGIRIVTSEAEL